MKIIICNGMVNIESDGISYGNIRNMYKTGSGCGLQVTKRLEDKEEEILDACSMIAGNIYALQDLIKGKDSQ